MRGKPLTLGIAERAALVVQAATLGVALDTDAADRFREFARLLDVWNARINLVSCAGARELVERHFVDSLAVGPLLGNASETVDLGSGAGFPGIPLAIAYPGKGLVLVEARRRRASFLREVGCALGLRNVEVIEERAERGPGCASRGPVAAAVCRAVWSDESALVTVSRWLAGAGRFFWMRGTRPGPDKAPGERGIQEMLFERRVGYRVGGRKRTIEIFRRR